MATKWLAVAMATVVSLVNGGCLLFDRTDTIYIEPDGAVTWSVIEKDVRSDAETPADRAREEAEYISAVSAQAHDLARALRQLTPVDLRARVLRPALPYSVVTEAKFSRLDVLGQRLIARLDLVGTSVLESTNDATQWTMTLRESRAPGNPHDDPEIEALSRGFDGMLVVLARGRFLSAKGFELSSDGRVARLVDDPAAEATLADGGDLVLSLRWR